MYTPNGRENNTPIPLIVDSKLLELSFSLLVSEGVQIVGISIKAPVDH